MLYAGLDLSRQRLDVHLMDEDGTAVEVTAVHPDADALRTLAAVVSRHGQPVTAVVESMNGARFIHDQLERWGWDVEVADVVRAKGLAPLAAKTDKIDARVLAELARRDLVPAIWLPDPSVREARERARFRLHLVRHRVALKNRIHATLMAFGHPVPVSDLFSRGGRELLERMAIPEPWATTLATSLHMVDDVEREIRNCEAELRRLGARPSLRPTPDDRARHRLGPRLHHRGRDRRYRSVLVSEEAHRLHGTLPEGPPVRPTGPSRGPHEARSQAPPLGARRGCHDGSASSALQGALPAHTTAPRPPARAVGRPGRAGPRPRDRYLAHAHQRTGLRSGRPRITTGRVTTPR